MEKIKISSPTLLFRASADDVVYIKAEGNYCTMYMYNGKERTFLLQLGKFDELFRQLSSNPFIRVGKSLIVNKDYINIINLTTREIILAGVGLRHAYEPLKASHDALAELKSIIEKEN